MFNFRKHKKQEQFQCPFSGWIIEIEEVADEMFSSKAMGDGFGVEPNQNTVYAPVSGTLCVCFPTGHAFGIQGDDGKEYLLHLGIDTVELNGAGFQVLVKEGDRIEQGQKLCEMDINYIQLMGKKATCMCIVTTGESIQLLKKQQAILHGEEAVFEWLS